MPLELFERFTVDEADMPGALKRLSAGPHLSEAVVVSTCNRTEVYARAKGPHGAHADVRRFLAELADVEPVQFDGHLLVRHDRAAVQHLFSVASGLDSAVLGEGEILGQIRRAWEQAGEERAAGPVLNLLFRHALEVGKRVRTETAISRGATSISQVAVEMAPRHLGDLRDVRVLIVGAGEMAEGMLTTLAGSGVAGVSVCNRTWSRACELASAIGATPLAFDDLPVALAQTDLLLTSTGSTTPIIGPAEVSTALAQRPERPMLVVDVAVPRDVDPTVRTVPGVTLVDMDDLTRFARKGLDRRSRELAAARGIVHEEVERYQMAAVSRIADPVVAALHEHADAIRTAELARFESRLAGLSDQQRDAVDALVHGVVAKLLHSPTMAVKTQAGSDSGDRLADALRELYGLD